MMQIKFRHYNSPDDYQLIDHFLIEHYQPQNRDRNWIEPIWEYMQYHPALDRSALEKIGIWMDDGNMVAVAHYESSLGEVFFQFHPGYRYLRQEMLDYAEENLYGMSEKDGSKYLSAYVSDNDEALISLVKGRGYTRDDERTRPMYQFEIPDQFPPIHLPDGYRLISLADDCNWAKVHQILWRGFNHEGEPPPGEGELEDRRKMFDTPNGRRDLKIVVVAPNGDFISFCGMFYEPSHHFAYVEPVATDPNYRRLGLGKAAVLEGIRRCGLLGASTSYVGSDQEFYQAIGFTKVFNSECWLKNLAA